MVRLMCYDLSEYDPFEPLYLYGYCEYDLMLELDSEPMTLYDWDNWLELENTK